MLDNLDFLTKINLIILSIDKCLSCQVDEDMKDFEEKRKAEMERVQSAATEGERRRILVSNYFSRQSVE